MRECLTWPFARSTLLIMSRRLTIGRAGLALVATTGALLAGGGSAEAATSPWTVMPAQTVADQNFILNAVAAPAAADIWTVGYHWENVGGALEFRALAEHSSGGGFTIVPTPDRETGAPVNDMLQDVSGVSSSDVWTVGTSRASGTPSQTLIEHWDGHTWRITTSANPGVYGNDLEGVTAIAPNDVWAVGARQDAFYQTPMAEHWNGATWTVATVPNPTGCTGHSYLTDVTAIATNNVWATGWCGSGGSTPEQGYIVRWNGTRWLVKAAYGDIPANTELYGVAARHVGDVWAVGTFRAGGGALAVHWNGHTWTQQTIGAPQETANLRAVAGTRGRLPWAVGAGPSPQPPFAGPTSIRFAADQGQPVPVDVSYGSLRGITFAPDGSLWAVGTQLPGKNDIPLIVSQPAPAG